MSPVSMATIGVALVVAGITPAYRYISSNAVHGHTIEIKTEEFNNR